jgi:hypothetical protein
MREARLRFRNLPGRKYILGFDTFIRHRLVADLATNFRPTTVLDVGGEGTLGLFMRGVEVTSANIKESDIHYAGDKLPLSDDSFDLVVSLDTIEHLPGSARLPFLKELYRVCKKGTIVCGPLGTPEHSAHEKRVLESGLLSGASRDYLAQHVEFGLPNPTEVCQMAGCFGGDVYYQGDFRRDVKVKRNQTLLLGYLNLILQALENIFISTRWDISRHVKIDYSPYTNRCFLVCAKQFRLE